MREKTKTRMRERIDSLTKDKEIFNLYVEKFYENNPFFGPSVYFHRKVIDLIRQSREYAELLESNLFIEYIYATLASWGMHRMGPKGAKLRTYDEFKQSILSNKDVLIKLSDYKLHKLNVDEKEKIKEDLLGLFSNLKVMQSGANLVGNSKAMHHLLPDLVPPIDRQYTIQFFYGSKMIGYREEGGIFLEIFDNFYLICKRLNLTEGDHLEGKEFTTSLPKLIDNAIIGYVLKNLK